MSVVHDKTHQRFTITVDGRTAYLAYRLDRNRSIDLRSTYVPPAIRNRGVGRQLVTHVLGYAEREGLEVIPTCWFARDVMDEMGRPDRGEGRRDGWGDAG